ncbi:uncharacterized protein [Malus domestica]|uniref:uncharacterized protein n=1 Tax=Malus domestica TaxID=3750 RepID=UPI00049889E0
MVAQEFVEHVFKLHGMPSTIDTTIRVMAKLRWLTGAWRPILVVYGYPPPHIASYEKGTAKLDIIEQGLLARDNLLDMLKTNLLVAQNRMKAQANKHRREKEFEVGDLVYLKLVPYQLQSLAAHAFHKLHPRFYGPYEVLERIGSVAYKLKLPTDSKIHPVFHVSCLKKHLGPGVSPLTTLPVMIEDGLQSREPMSILQRRVYRKGNGAGVQLLVHWKGSKEEDATWEDYDELAKKFLDFSL